MNYSLNEIEALAKKASRGAGLSWGMSEEAGKAVRWLVSNGLSGTEALAALLTENDGKTPGEVAPKSLEGTWSAGSGSLCPLASGAALNDCADRILEGQGIEMDRVAHPLLVLPFAGWAAIHLGSVLVVSWETLRIGTDGWAVWIDDKDNCVSVATPVRLNCRPGGDLASPMTTPALRGVIAPDVMRTLSTFAHRTYAPATEASRLLGAGAGVSDND